MSRQKIMFIAAILLTITVFWINSSLPTSISDHQSNSAKQIVEQVADNTDLPGVKYIESHIRKSAHALEYLILGIELALYILVCLKKTKFGYLWNAFAVCMFVAVADESIQILSKRGPLIYDVLLDISSAAVGALVVFSIYGIIKLVKRGKNHAKA